MTTDQFQLPMMKELLRSMNERFRDIYEYGPATCVCSSLLDLLHGFRWLKYCELSINARNVLRKKVFGRI